MTDKRGADKQTGMLGLIRSGSDRQNLAGAQDLK